VWLGEPFFKVGKNANQFPPSTFFGEWLTKFFTGGAVGQKLFIPISHYSGLEKGPPFENLERAP